MANKSLTDLTARTDTADSDLLHINSGGTDYKELKSDFLHGSFGISFDNTSLLTAQVDALNLPNKSGFSGIIEAWGHASETGLPVGATYYVSGYIYRDTYKVIEIWRVTDPNVRYQCSQQSGIWGSWTQLPARSEITSINNTLAKTYTIHDDFTFTNGACVVASGNVTSQARLFICQRYAPNGDLSPKIFVSQPQGSSGGFNIYCRYVLTSGGWGAYNGTLPLDVLVINP